MSKWLRELEQVGYEHSKHVREFKHRHADAMLPPTAHRLMEFRKKAELAMQRAVRARLIYRIRHVFGQKLQRLIDRQAKMGGDLLDLIAAKRSTELIGRDVHVGAVAEPGPHLIAQPVLLELSDQAIEIAEIGLGQNRRDQARRGGRGYLPDQPAQSSADIIEQSQVSTPFVRTRHLSLRRAKAYSPAAFLRLSQALQYCGHFMPAGTLPAALSAFHSAPQALIRLTSPALPPDGAAAAGFAAGVAAGAVAVAGAGAATGLAGAVAAGLAAAESARHFVT